MAIPVLLFPYQYNISRLLRAMFQIGPRRRRHTSFCAATADLVPIRCKQVFIYSGLMSTTVIVQRLSQSINLALLRDFWRSRLTWCCVAVTRLGNILHMIRAARTGTVWVSKLRRRDAQSRSEPRGNPGEFLENSDVNATQILMAAIPLMYRFTLVEYLILIKSRL